jgi:hypothetical protein
MTAFVGLREILVTHKDLARKLKELEKKFAQHDALFQKVFEAIHQLINPDPVPPSRRIGFTAEKK